MKRIGGIVAIVLALTLTACSSSRPSAEPTSAPNEAVAPEAAGIVVPDFTGMAADEARDQLADLGLTHEYDAGDDFVVLAGNWVVNSQSPAAGETAEEGSAVTLVVSKPEPEPAPEPAAPAPAAATSTGLTEVSARATCDLAGQIEFPYKYDPHWILGVMATEIVNDQWFFKVETTVENAFGNELDVVVECTVAGPNENPALVGYTYY